MTLNAFVSDKKKLLFEDLSAGRAPREGEYSEAILKEGRVKEKPQMGTTRFEPNAVILEYIYPDKQGSSVVLPVKIASPERILFMPVPGWVVESIWQGEIDGSFHFETEAATMLAEFAKMLEAEDNQKLFGPRQATRRE
ncbi:MAG TPA: hypothetical protein VGL56_02295 [Fimbriimonadaceae bacterium]|jgi:hypothetical protein